MTDTILLPLSMPGWPAAEQPSALLLIALLVGIPVAVGAVLALLTALPWFVRRARGEDTTDAGEPLWLGDADESTELGGADGDPAALTSGEDADKQTTGGSSVRW